MSGQYSTMPRSADQSRAVNERRALIDRLIGYADFYRLAPRQPREGVRLRALTSPGPGKTQILDIREAMHTRPFAVEK